MQQRPTRTVLLQAIARFLVAEAYPGIPDKRLNFRVLIAANLANIVAAEMESGQELVDEEVARLAELMPDVAAGRERAQSEAHRRELLLDLSRELAARIRDHRLSASDKRRAWEHVRETLRRTLAIDNPRFDTSHEIE